MRLGKLRAGSDRVCQAEKGPKRGQAVISLADSRADLGRQSYSARDHRCPRGGPEVGFSRAGRPPRVGSHQ